MTTEFAGKLETVRSANQAETTARRIEAARACKPGIDYVQAFLSSLSGGNHGTIRVSASGVAPAKEVGVLAAVRRAVQRDQAERAAVNRVVLTPEQRAAAAMDLRAMADRMDRG